MDDLFPTHILRTSTVKLVQLTNNYRFIADTARSSTISIAEDKGNCVRHKMEKTPEADRKLVTYLLNHEHLSPFEQVHVIYDIVTPLFVARQFNRHRSIKTWNDEIIVGGSDFQGSLNELSGRYSVMSNFFYIPRHIHYQHETNKQMSGDPFPEGQEKADAIKLIMQSYEIAYNTYQELLAKGVAREQARLVLPQGIYTAFRCSLTIRHLVDFLKLRLTEEAQIEIRDLAKDMLRELNSFDSILFDIIGNYIIKSVFEGKKVTKD